MKKNLSPLDPWNPDSLEVALTFSQQGASIECPMLPVAAALRPDDTGIHERPRAETKDRMLRAFHAAGVHTSPAVPPRTDLGESPGVHTAAVTLPNGAALTLADIEAITPQRAADIADRIAVAAPAVPHD